MMPASNSYRNINANEVAHKNRARRQYHDTLDTGGVVGPPAGEVVGSDFSA
jgi:hypothetical protein